MFVRLTHFSIPPERAEEVKNIYYNDIAPVIRDQPGILDVMLLVPRNAADEYISCTIWKNNEYTKTFEGSAIYPEVFGKIKVLTFGAPYQKYYDVPQH